MTDAKLSYTIDEAAKAVGVSRATIYRKVREGELATFKWCGRTLIDADVLRAAKDRARAATEQSGGRAAA